MCGARKTVDAAVFTTAIGVDRPVKRQIGRAVVSDDLARHFHRNLGANGRQILVGFQHLWHDRARQFVPARRVADSTPRAPLFLPCEPICDHFPKMEHKKNICKLQPGVLPNFAAQKPQSTARVGCEAADVAIVAVIPAELRTNRMKETQPGLSRQ